MIDTSESANLGATVPWAVLLPRNMGNRGQNTLSVPETFRRLRLASSTVSFIAYHPRPSGNFVFEGADALAIEQAVSIGERAIGLRCLARSFDDLTRVDRSVPPTAEVVRNSVVLQTPPRVMRVVFVALSEGVDVRRRVLGPLRKRIDVLSWPSDRDVLCLYERRGESGDVGNVTRALEGRLRAITKRAELVGTGRAMMVIRDILSGRRLKTD